MVLVTGPTGSGKTTTLYAALSELNTTERKIITVEDPVEYRLPSINQVQVHEKIELGFDRVLRSALRQDPDAAEPQKIGLFRPTSWVAYRLGSDLFFKWSAADPAGAYPDFGCSLEIFTNRFMMELETLGPITKVEPNQTVEHIEHWMLLRDVALSDLSDSSIGQALEPAFFRIPSLAGGKP
jgi:hypothetical protein